MTKYIQTSGIFIPNDDTKFDEAANNLTRDIEQFNGDVKTIKFYSEVSGGIMIPRYHHSIPEECIQIDSCVGDDIEIECSIIPRNIAQEQSIKLLSESRNAILKLEPSRGKTCIAIKAISNIKKKTIIIVHKDSLIENWEKEILEFTNLTKDDIGRLSVNNYKKSLNKKIILTTPHVIGLAENKFKESEKYNDFIEAINSANIGILVVDEAHIGIGPEMFSKTSLRINAFRTFGLTATPMRYDGNEDLIEMHLGKLHYFEPEESEIINPTINMVYINSKTYKDHRKYIQYGGKFNPSKYYGMLRKSDIYMDANKYYIKAAYKSGRNVLVLGSIIKPLLELAEMCDLPKSDVGIYIPGSKDSKYKSIMKKLTDQVDLNDAFFNKRIVFATYGVAREGNNRPSLDTLIMFNPTGNIEQAIGRIQRVLQDKKSPIVIDFVDTDGPRINSLNINMFERMSQKREDIYNSKNWKINKIKYDKIQFIKDVKDEV